MGKFRMYDVCRYCNGRLDFGERCDCVEVRTAAMRGMPDYGPHIGKWRQDDPEHYHLNTNSNSSVNSSFFYFLYLLWPIL